ncbi:MAG: cell division protein FtsQ/DivIB [Micrococcales bacterium]|nr:cell division protein FtsQ/DivIB [Micrococcales bacterium]
MSPARPPRPRRTTARSGPVTPSKTSAKTPRVKPSRPAKPARGEVVQTPGAGPPSIAPRDRVVVEQAAQRFAERAQARRRVTRRKVATVVAVVLGVVVLGWAAFFSPVLGLDTDQVDIVGDGGTALTDDIVAVDDVRAVVVRHVGEPLPRLDTAALRTELLVVHGVKDVHVVRDWPRGLTVTVTPRVPVAAVPVDDQVALLDADGVRLRTEPVAPEGLPVVQVPLDDTRALLAALTVVDALPPDQASQVATVAAPTQDTVTLTLADGVQVLWGSAEDSTLKAQVVATLRADQTLADVTTIDVSAPQMPVLR